jgi:hypothetical protein
MIKSIGRKISKFIVKTAIGGSDLLPFVADSTNYAITVDNFVDSLGLNGTKPRALLALTGNSTETVITTANVPVKVAGTWSGEIAEAFTLTAGGRATYTGTNSKTLNIDVAVTMHPVSAGNVELCLYIAKNGAVVSTSHMSATVKNNEFQELSLPWVLNFATGDYVEVFVANHDTTVNVLVTEAVLRVS